MLRSVITVSIPVSRAEAGVLSYIAMVHGGVAADVMEPVGRILRSGCEHIGGFSPFGALMALTDLENRCIIEVGRTKDCVVLLMS